MTENFPHPHAENCQICEDLRLALEIVEHVDRLTLTRFGAADLQVETKPDLTPVSDADKAAESLVRTMIATQRPHDLVYGEEEGGQLCHSGRRWIVDPIDGTKNFVRKVPVWATLLALEDKGKIVLGVVSAPALSRRWYAGLSHGAFVSWKGEAARRIYVSGVNEIADASLAYSSLTGWRDRGLREKFLALTDSCWRTRGYGDFWSYMMVAEGIVDLAMEPELNLYDMAALAPIVTEAGGQFTSLSGSEGPWGSDALASNGFLHETALAALGLV